jgi:outer membrane protein OmpA-like peptidoglycan-associated protein
MLRLVVGVATCVPIATASAQTLTEGDILQSLTTAGGAAQAVNLDVDAIKRDIEERIRVEGTENAADPPPALQALTKLPNLTVEIQFDYDSDWILPVSWETVGLMADALHHPLLMGYKFAVIGHTDATGSRQYNLELGQRRALSVREMLVSTFQVDPEMLVVLGFGEEQLRDPQAPDSGANRRVQLLNIGPRN